MTELIPAPCEECEHIEYGMHYYVIEALVRKIARDSGGGWVNRCVNVSGGILPLLG